MHELNYKERDEELWDPFPFSGLSPSFNLLILASVGIALLYLL